MLDKINAIEARYNEINQLIEQSVDDYTKTNELMKERSDIEEIVEKGREYKSALQQMEDAKELIGGQDHEMAELAISGAQDALMTLSGCSSEMAASIRQREDKTDSYEDALGSYLIKVSAARISERDGRRATELQR